MNNIFEKLVETDFEDTFKPISGDEITKRRAERVANFNKPNGDLANFLFDMFEGAGLERSFIEEWEKKDIEDFIHIMRDKKFLESIKTRMGDLIERVADGLDEYIEYEKGNS